MRWLKHVLAFVFGAIAALVCIVIAVWAYAETI
jgi:hypothetical protein